MDSLERGWEVSPVSSKACKSNGACKYIHYMKLSSETRTCLAKELDANLLSIIRWISHVATGWRLMSDVKLSICGNCVLHKQALHRNWYAFECAPSRLIKPFNSISPRASSISSMCYTHGQLLFASGSSSLTSARARP